MQMHFVAAGEGPVVVLLHGFPETHRSWDLQVPALVQAGFRVITPDLRGYGSTDRPRNGYELQNLGRDIVALIHAVSKEPVSLVGHDWGGAVAWHVASRHPLELERLVVLNCPHPVRMLEALLSDPDQLRRSWYMFFFQLPMLPEWWLTKDEGANLVRLFRASFRSPRKPPPEILEASRKSLLEPGASRAAIAYYRHALRSWFHPLRMGKVRRSYPSIDAPVTLIWGQGDVALGERLIDGTERFARRLEVVRIPGAGHFVHQEEPDLVNEHLIERLRAG
jgi:pimeloyl-ACP methyl ester carboxylesterase